MANEWARAQEIPDKPHVLSRECFEIAREQLNASPAFQPSSILVSPEQHRRLVKHREAADHPTWVICEGCLSALYGGTHD